MLNKKKKAVGNMDTVIGSETVVEGKINSEASLRIEGKIYGEVVCEGDVTVGESGVVECNIKARHVTIAGKVKGNINAEGKLHIHETGKLHGNAQVKSIVIDEGGVLHGETSMKEGVADPKKDHSSSMAGSNREAVNQ